jgi:formamidopyrimidine-DNA glycosylase
MPELPEVETTRRGVAPLLTGRIFTGAVLRQPRLRWPIDPELAERLAGRRVRQVARRAKYLLIELDDGATLIIHLGMSGSLRHLPADTPPERHDHVDLLLGEHCLRYRDPRRFGAILYCPGPVELHPLLVKLGPEPLSDDFDGEVLFAACRGKTAPIKTVLMDNHVVVGVGNIYANEALFAAGVRPTRPAGQVSREECQRLAAAIRATLLRAIEAGGSTLRDFTDAIGKPGYFQQHYAVYGRDGLPCHACATLVQHTRLGQRSSFYCPHCQT